MVETHFVGKDVFPRKIESERLYYELLHQSDITARQLFEKNTEITREHTKYVSFSPYKQMIEGKEYLEHTKKEFENGDAASYAIFKEETDEFIGTTGLEIDWEQRKAESGVFLYPEYWGNGYATERGKAILEVAFSEYNIDIWYSRCHIDNTASQNCIEKYVVDQGGEKCGYLPHYKLGDKIVDVYLYAIRREEYESSE